MCFSQARFRLLAVVLFSSLLACGGEASEQRPTVAVAPLQGLLQFHVVHNLEDDSCLATGDCSLSLEDTEGTTGWLEAIDAETTMPVLHWDQPIPWLQFTEAPPSSAERVAFYDGRIDAPLRKWIDAFSMQFAQHEHGFLAVSMLHGDRRSLQQLRSEAGTAKAVGGDCPELSPESVFDVEGESFEIGQSYSNFLLYLHDKLRPTRMGLMVEANLFLANCPARWNGLVALYRHVYDAVRGEVGGSLPLFSTFVLTQLLGFDEASCTGGLSWTPCGQEPAAPPVLDAEICYPLDRSAIDDFAAGGRLDLLALSFYPDGLSMAFPSDTDPRFELYSPAAFAAGESCTVHARLPQLVDPLAAIDRLGWEGPIVFAETSARSCPSFASVSDGKDDYIAVVPGNEARQVWWMNAVLDDAAARSAEFVVWSFLRDYPPLGTWVFEQGVIDPDTFNLLNVWPCSGILDSKGSDKGAARKRWRSGFEP